MAKFKRQHKGRVPATAKTCFCVTPLFDVVSVKAGEPARVSQGQLNALHSVFRKQLRRSGKLSFDVFPNRPVSKKPLAVRMGKGKGDVQF
jgi:large subunit ribosomal protein L16